ncbi:hypothetical protein B9479_004052 [Cryptococcus floricola]|uniref:Uncharacterized protein n=1 Tax=Cryptococcus floricola TaxID=2591691 RepID=A0A5D3AWH9_9TREE|nr:hypothetical protein B9479_004052 [Cryptococcus floricola]
MTLSNGARVAIIAVASLGWIPFAVIAIHVSRRRRQRTARMRGRPLPNFSLPNLIQQQANIQPATSRTRPALGDITNLQKVTSPSFKPAMKPQSSANSLHLPTNTHKQNSLRRKPLPPFLVPPSQAKVDSIPNHADLADGTPLEIEQMVAKILGGKGRSDVKSDVLAGDV